MCRTVPIITCSNTTREEDQVKSQRRDTRTTRFMTIPRRSLPASLMAHRRTKVSCLESRRGGGERRRNLSGSATTPARHATIQLRRCVPFPRLLDESQGIIHTSWWLPPGIPSACAASFDHSGDDGDSNRHLIVLAKWLSLSHIFHVSLFPASK